MKRINYKLHSTNDYHNEKLTSSKPDFLWNAKCLHKLSLSWHRYLTHIMQLVCGEVTKGSQFKGKNKTKNNGVLARCRVTNPDSSFNASWHRVSP